MGQAMDENQEIPDSSKRDEIFEPKKAESPDDVKTDDKVEK